MNKILHKEIEIDNRM